MIPVPVFPTDFFLAVFLFLIGLLWLAKIIIQGYFHSRQHPDPKIARSAYWRSKWLSLVFSVMLQLPILYYVYVLAKAFYINYATHPTLKQPLRYGDIVFPAGTQLVLHYPNDLTKIHQARLSQPILIKGLQVKFIEFNWHRVSLQIAQDATIEGWDCDHRQKIDFAWEFDQIPGQDADISVGHIYATQPSRWHLAFCALQENKTYFGLRWPKNSIVERTSGLGVISISNSPQFNFITKEDQPYPVVFHEGQLSEITLDFHEDFKIWACNGKVAKSFQVAGRTFSAGEQFSDHKNCESLKLESTR
jgi:hypothetical protein